jgi:hypothetical protein
MPVSLFPVFILGKDIKATVVAVVPAAAEGVDFQTGCISCYISEIPASAHMGTIFLTVSAVLRTTPKQISFGKSSYYDPNQKPKSMLYTLHCC